MKLNFISTIQLMHPTEITQYFATLHVMYHAGFITQLIFCLTVLTSYGEVLSPEKKISNIVEWLCRSQLTITLKMYIDF